MKKLFLSIVLLFASFASFACIGYMEGPISGCISTNPETGHQDIKMIWTVEQYAAWDDYVIYVPNPAGGFFGPFSTYSVTALYSGGTGTGGTPGSEWVSHIESHYDLGFYTLPSPLACTDFYIVSKEFCLSYDPYFEPDETFDPSIDNYVEGHKVQIVRVNLCPCGDEPTPPPCFTDMGYRTFSSNQNILEVYPLYPNVGSGYKVMWDAFGGAPDNTYTRSDISKLYTAPGVKTVCLAEYRGTTKYCSKCIAICVGGPTPATPATPAPCTLDFAIERSWNQPYRVDIYPTSPNPSSTYEYSFNGYTIVPSIYNSFTYPGPGTYQICVYEKNSANTIVCQKCIDMCIAPRDVTSPIWAKTTNNAVIGETVDREEISLFPNPTNGNTTLNISLSENQKVEYSIIDMTGKKVSSNYSENLKAGNNKIDLNTTHLSSGIYQVQIRIGNELSTKKLSVIK